MLRLLAHQVRFDLLVFRRNPAAMVFSVVIPILFFAIIGTFTTNLADEDISAALTASFVAFAVIGISLVNMAMTMTIRRERGLLKRVRTTPMSPWMFVVSQAAVSLIVAFAVTLLMGIVSPFVTGFDPSSINAGSLLLTLIIGVLSLASMGIALSSLIPSEETAPAMVQGLVLPLYFVSGIFVPFQFLPGWLQAIGKVFPFYHFAAALDASLSGQAPRWQALAVMVAWAVASIALVTRRFSWMPRR